jgi:hypothetical protein
MDAAPGNPLLPLWQAALSRPVHNAACGCAVPAAVRLDARTLELDLLDYVEERHALHAMPAWQQSRARRSEAPAGSFPDWLASLNGDCLAPELYRQVAADLAGSLQSIAEHAAGRLTPAAAKTPGWLGGGRLQAPAGSTTTDESGDTR